MVKSMTGFGRSERVTDAYKIVVEMKSVNHRFCDINIFFEICSYVCLKETYLTTGTLPRSTWDISRRCPRILKLRTA